MQNPPIRKALSVLISLIWANRLVKAVKAFEGMKMCEFSVLLKEKTVFKDAIYAKVDGGKVMVKDVLGSSRVFENCKIVEVNVSSEVF